MAWNGWPLARTLHFFLGLLFLGIFVQTTLFHWRQNFRDLSMWGPVLLTPILGIVGLTWAYTPWAPTLYIILLWLGLLSGLYGFIRHLLGVGQRVDGYTTFNFLAGPPVVLPLVIVLLSSLGLASLGWWF